MKKKKSKRKTISEDISEYFCDICKSGGIERNLDKSSGENWNSGNNWETNLYFEIGDSYPECEEKEGKKLDICVNCMKTKVIPLLEKTFGIKARKTHSEY